MNVFKWEKVIDVLVEKSNILEKENNMDRDLVYVFITEMMWSKFGLKGTAKNILAVKKYKAEFSNLIKENDLEKLSTATYTKGTLFKLYYLLHFPRYKLISYNICYVI